MQQQTPATIVIVDDDESIRTTLGLRLKSEGFNVVEYAEARSFWDAFHSDIPVSCLIVDVMMPGMDGLELQARLKEHPYHPPLIMISGTDQIPTAVKALKEGALDFLQKPFDDDLLVERVYQAISQDEKDRDRYARESSVHQRLERLTPRELEVMELVVAGKLNKVIAADLGVSTRTVEIHRARVMEKMEARTLSDLIHQINLIRSQ